MKFILRIFIVFGLTGSVVLAAQRYTVEAGSSNENLPDTAVGSLDDSLLLNNAEAGTVKPPSSQVVITEDGKYSVGGICTVQVEGLSAEYGLKAYSINRDQLGPLPNEAIRILNGTCYIQYFQQTPRLNLPQLPVAAGSVTICFAHIPQNKLGRIYSYDLSSGAWAGLTTFVQNIASTNRNIACASAIQSRAYALLRVRE